jgi:hypothetical protein
MHEVDLRVEFMDRQLRTVGFAGTAGAAESVAWVERSCFSNALRLLPIAERAAGKELFIVAGSLGLSAPPPVWYEWGGFGAVRHEYVHQFARCAVTGLPSVHFWISDAEAGLPGRVFDVLDPYLQRVAEIRGKRIDRAGLLHGVAIVGLELDDLERRGLRYAAASPLVSDVMVQRTSQRMKIVDV